MTIDLNTYSVNKEFVQQWYRNHQELVATHTISYLASITFCPAIAVAYWVGESSNWSADVVECIKRLEKFYRYDKVLNKPEGAP